MRIGVLSDTHARTFAEIPLQVLDAFSGVDLIIHCGDFVARDVFEGLKRLKELRAVRGNMDFYELRGLLPEKELFSFGGKRIGITHGSGSPYGIEQRVRSIFHQVDAIIYGHSHTAQNRVIDGILFFNPGMGQKSFGVLTIEEEIIGEIIQL